MGMIPDGLQKHVLFMQDGRIWIENWYAAGGEKIDRGVKYV